MRSKEPSQKCAEGRFKCTVELLTSNLVDAMSATASARTSLEDGSKRPELDESLASAEKANDESVPQVAAAQGPFKRFSEVLSRFGVEVRGVDRVPDTPTDRRPVSVRRGSRTWKFSLRT